MPAKFPASTHCKSSLERRRESTTNGGKPESESSMHCGTDNLTITDAGHNALDSAAKVRRSFKVVMVAAVCSGVGVVIGYALCALSNARGSW